MKYLSFGRKFPRYKLALPSIEMVAMCRNPKSAEQSCHTNVITPPSDLYPKYESFENEGYAIAIRDNRKIIIGTGQEVSKM